MLAADLLCELLRHGLSAGQPIPIWHTCAASPPLSDAGGIHERKLKSGKAIVPEKTCFDRRPKLLC